MTLKDRLDKARRNARRMPWIRYAMRNRTDEASEWISMLAATRYSKERANVPKAFRRAWKNPTRRILCGRGTVAPRKVLALLFTVNGYWPVFDPSRPHEVSIGTLGSDKPTLNARYIGSEKTKVAAAWESVCGYALAVDPLTYEGPMVEKSEANATHDGRILHGPIGPSDLVEGKVYQRLVDTEDDGEVVDLRTPIYQGRVPLVIRKRRALNNRFEELRTAQSFELVEPDDAFTPDELRQLSEFASVMGLDYGELDVLRDRVSDRIYVVDATPGPSGPPLSKLPEGVAPIVVSRLAKAFDDTIEQALRTVPDVNGL
ncbi:MAG: hypothetical protein AAGK21_12590 [Bacteroidota bacterium]